MPKNRKEILLIDSSVLINFIGSTIPREILSGLPFQILITPQVIKEIWFDPVQRKKDNNLLTPLLKENLLHKKAMGEEEHKIFFKLIGAEPGEDLGDGESSCIASAACAKTKIALDDGKARRICREQFPELEILCSVDLFQIFRKNSKMEDNQFQQILFYAIKNSKMRVFPKYDSWIKEILGEELLRKCTSLKLNRYL